MKGIPVHTNKGLTPEIFISHHYVAVYTYKRKGSIIPDTLAGRREVGKGERVELTSGQDGR